MATEESSPPTPPSPPLLQQQLPIFPQYPEMIMAAVEALNEPNGSSKTAIAKHMEAMHPDLPAAHSTLLAHHLNKMKQSGQLVMFKNTYMKPDPNGPPKRGRGRPPKPKEPLPTGAVISPPRPRGRPPKPRDPLAPPALPKKSSGGSGKPRGRPPKKMKTDQVPAPPTGSSRGRGRPPKVKPAVAPVGC